MMNINRATILSILCLSLSIAVAQDGDRRQQFIKKFDTDSDGKLSDSEKTKARAAFKKRFMDRFDTDGDGTLNDTEKAEAKSAIEKLKNAFDADGDGKLSDEEKATARKAYAKKKASGN